MALRSRASRFSESNGTWRRVENMSFDMLVGPPGLPGTACVSFNRFHAGHRCLPFSLSLGMVLEQSAWGSQHERADAAAPLCRPMPVKLRLCVPLGNPHRLLALPRNWTCLQQPWPRTPHEQSTLWPQSYELQVTGSLEPNEI
jgi:hypothetical protein